MGDLRRIRLKLTLTFVALAAIVVAALGAYSWRTGADGIRNSAERELALRAAQIVASPGTSTASNAWIVNPSLEASRQLGEAWVEPPLFTIAGRTGTTGRYDTIEQGKPWLLYSQSLNDTEFVVTAMDLDPYEDETADLRRRLLLAGLGSLAVISMIGWWVSGRSLGPAHTALRQQKDFIADAAHEMRTPLAVIRASASHTLSRSRSEDAYRESLAEILSAAERAGEGVDQLLELARLEAGQLALRRAPLRLDLLAHEIAAASRYDDTSIVATPSPQIEVSGDRALLSQLIDGLIRNSVARASTVWVSTGIDESTGDALLEVTDDGPGFDPAALPHVFDRFRRGDSKGSAGLGLAITRTIANAHGGRCEAANREEGGASVRVWLPVLAS